MDLIQVILYFKLQNTANTLFYYIYIPCGVCWGWRSGAMGKVELPSRYLTPYFGYIYFTPTLVSRCTSQKNYTKEKTATDKRRRRFFYTFLYLLGSTTIPWMREFFLNTLKWWILQLSCQKYVNRFHVCMCLLLVFRASIRIRFLLEVCQSPVRVSLQFSCGSCIFQLNDDQERAATGWKGLTNATSKDVCVVARLRKATLLSKRWSLPERER